MSGAPTASQTAGPFVEIGMAWCASARVVEPSADGALVLSGRVLDGAGAPVTDAALEIWQADPSGTFASDPDAAWTGFTRVLTDSEGRYSVTTCKPGRIGEGAEAPHVSISIFARGLLQRLVTHVYFADEPESNGADATLAAVPPDRRGRLFATPVPGGYRFDIVLQGEEETPFFVP
jgi:protocatechuate 3,4-dioxygenase alpha subunit